MTAAPELSGELEERLAQPVGGVAVVVQVYLHLATAGADEAGKAFEVLGVVLLRRIQEGVPRRGSAYLKREKVSGYCFTHWPTSARIVARPGAFFTAGS